MKLKNIIKWLLPMLAICLSSCSKETETDGIRNDKAILNLAATFKPMTRLGELGSPSDMGDDVTGRGLKDIGLYVYYSSDYNGAAGVTQPYIRNMRCEVDNSGMVTPVGAVGADKNIYIYDDMTVVAYYPYNPDAPVFTQKSDEDLYYITKDDYSEQYFIPYRAITSTNPTVSYYTRLNFIPRHTFKIEVVVVAASESDFPDQGSVKILPNVDPVDNTDLSADDKREAWYDKVVTNPADAGGFPIQLYTAYIWTKKPGRENEINKGDVIFQSDNLTLIASQNMNIQEDFVYRYGYNLNTGEMFIPTSTSLIHDVASLAGVNGSAVSNHYQVCDIDISKVTSSWNPLEMVSTRYDGGGHKIMNMTVNGDYESSGLFGTVRGNSVICNVNLVDPIINVTSSTEPCFVGGICGELNAELTAADKQQLIGNLPAGLSEVVKQALIDEIMQSLVNTTSDIVACRVENPVITVEGNSPYVGTVAGRAGYVNETGSYISRIWDVYSLGGSLSVNSGDPAANANGYVGGFAGQNNGTIHYSYTTINNITAQREVASDPITYEDMYTGFTNAGTGSAITDSYTMLADVNSGVTQFSSGWPAWATYTGWWPIIGTTWLGSPSSQYWYDFGNSATPKYPILQWERR